MSKEATGENGAILGSSEYWDRVNRATFFGRLMRNASDTNYQETLREVGHRAGSAVEEIYDDLQNNIKSVRAISSDRRSSLAKQVQGLYDVCSMAGAFCSHSSDCIGILNLSSFYLPSNSFGDDRAIPNAIHKIKNCPDFFASECIELIRQAADWSVSFAAGSDARKSAFLKDVSQGKDREFLREVLNAYYSNDDTTDLRGNCGYSIGSREYRDYMERKVFLQDLPAMSGDDYDGALRDALTSVANQLQRDLAKNERENNYITDETTRKLRDAVGELGHCGISVGFADSAIERLDWFVGGDADKIRRLQSKLNELGVGQRLEEDGVYGKETKAATQNLITRISSLLADPNKMRLLDQTVDAIASALDFAGGPQSQIRELHDALEKGRREFQRTVWKLGAEYYLRARGYDVAALLLEHSIDSSPSNLYFSQSHWVTQKIMNSNGFKAAYRELAQNIQEKPDVYAVSGSIQMDFGGTGDTDLYYGIGKCEIKYTCIRSSSSVRIRFSIEDKYNFDHIRSISWDIESGVKFHLGDFGNLANDAGLLSQADSVISIFHTYIDFEKTVEMEGMYL